MKQGTGLPLGSLGFVRTLFSRIMVLSTAALAPAVIDIWFRYKFPGAAAVPGVQLYSTYTMLPSPLMSPYSFSTVAEEPHAAPPQRVAGGTMPVANAPNTDTGAPAA